MRALLLGGPAHGELVPIYDHADELHVPALSAPLIAPDADRFPVDRSIITYTRRDYGTNLGNGYGYRRPLFVAEGTPDGQVPELLLSWYIANDAGSRLLELDPMLAMQTRCAGKAPRDRAMRYAADVRERLVGSGWLDGDQADAVLALDDAASARMIAALPTPPERRSGGGTWAGDDRRGAVVLGGAAPRPDLGVVSPPPSCSTCSADAPNDACECGLDLSIHDPEGER